MRFCLISSAMFYLEHDFARLHSVDGDGFDSAAAINHGPAALGLRHARRCAARNLNSMLVHGVSAAAMAQVMPDAPHN
jgi:hypothetical protein